jgi:hypothetical protein
MKERFIRAYRWIFGNCNRKDAEKAWWKYGKVENGRQRIIAIYETQAATAFWCD